MAASTRTVPTLAGAAAAAVIATLWAGLPVHAQTPAATATTPVAVPAAPPPVTSPSALPAASTAPAALPTARVTPVSPSTPPAASAAPLASPVTVTVRTPLNAPDDNYLSRLAELQRQITLQEKERELRELQVKVEQLEYERRIAVLKTRDADREGKGTSDPKPSTGPGWVHELLKGAGGAGGPAAAPSGGPTTVGPSSALPAPDTTAKAPVPEIDFPVFQPPSNPVVAAPVVSTPRATANVSAVRGVGENMTADLILEDGSVVTVKAGDRVPGVGTVSRISSEGVYVGGGKRGGGRRLSFSNNIPGGGGDGGMGMPGLPMPPMNIPYTPTSMPTMPNITLPGSGQLAGSPQVPLGGQTFDGPLPQ